MFTKELLLIILITLSLSIPVCADSKYESAVYHSFELEASLGSSDNDIGIADWDFDGWIGTDENKLWLRSEGERENGVASQAEFWAMYSRNIHTFWDLQIGVRYDTQPDPLTYAIIGFAGLAPYFFETEIHFFISNDGDVSARIYQENEFLLTQRLITQPYMEANFYAQDISELEVGAGLANAELGIQLRYELTRSFAPYVDVRYERKFGETSSIAKNHGENNDTVIGTLGIKFLF